jgi:hypothetical protein
VGSYYYLVSTLPTLSYGQQPPMESGAFKTFAAQSMGGAEGQALDLCVLDPGPDAGADMQIPFPFVKGWREWERTLLLNLAKGRAARVANADKAGYDAPDYPADAAQAAKNALAMDDPLEAEIALDKARWAAIENLQGIETFSENTIYAYLLKLRLCERRRLFDAETGFKEYTSLYDSILKASNYSFESME